MQEEYVKGVSSWNFDLAALKAQAAMEPDDGSVPQTPTFPAMPTIMEGSEAVEAEGSGASSRRSTDDSAAVPLSSAAAPPAAAAVVPAQQQAVQVVQELPPPQQQVTAAQVVQQQVVVQQTVSFVQQHTTTAVQQLVVNEEQQQAAMQIVQQQQQQAAEVTQPVAIQQQQQQVDATAAVQQQQLQAINSMRRASSAFAGSSALAAAAAAAGANIAAMGSTSQLQGHFSEPAAVQNTQQQTTANAINIVGGSSGGSSYCLSPLNGSPPMSRESSSQGPLGSLATTPEAIPLRGKSKGRHGRFQVYEHGEEPPPMSPPANRGIQEGLTGSFSRSSGLVSEGRLSDPAGEAAVIISSTRQTPETEGLLAAAVAAAPVSIPAAAAAVLSNGNLPAASVSTGSNVVVGFAASAEHAAIAAADGIGVGPSGTVSGSSTPPLPPAGPSGNVAGLAVSGTVSEGTDASGITEPKKRGRFKIIEEEPSAASRGSVSKTPSSADLGKSALKGLGGSTAGVLPDLQKLHEQAVNHQQALSSLIDRLKAGGSLGNLAAAGEDATAAAAGGLVVARKTSNTGGLSRSTSNKAFGGAELRQLTVQLLLPQYENNAEDLAERLLERGQELERRLSDVLEENQRLKLKLALADVTVGDSVGSGSQTGGHSSSGNALVLRGEQQDSNAASRATSRRVSAANYPSPTAASGGGSGAAAGQQQVAAGPAASSSSLPNGIGGGLGDRYSSGGASGDSSSSAASGTAVGAGIVSGLAGSSEPAALPPAAVLGSGSFTGSTASGGLGGSLARESVASMYWKS